MSQRIPFCTVASILTSFAVAPAVDGSAVLSAPSTGLMLGLGVALAVLASNPRRGRRTRPWPALRRAAAALAVVPVALIATAHAARAISIPGYNLIDTIVVPSSGAAVSSSVSLASGISYKLHASGMFVTGSGVLSDAEYLFGVVGPADYCINGGISQCDYGIAIDDPTVGGLKLPYWGPYSATHEYTIDFVGLGAPLSFVYHDDQYQDNSGQLSVEIFAVPEPGTGSLLALAIGGWAVARRRRID